MPEADRAAPLEFLSRAFLPEDWVAVLLKQYETGRTSQRVRPLSAVMSPRFQAWLRVLNTFRRFNAFVGVNAVRPGRSRTKAAIAGVRHLFLDVDRNAPELLRTLTSRRDLPPCSYVLHSSPGRVHMFWRVSGFDAERVEALQKHLARELGTDVAATPCTQTTRLAGFINYKYARPYVVTVDYQVPNAVWTPSDFPPLTPQTSAPTPTAPSEGVPASRVAQTLKPGRPDAVERARRFLARTCPAISGQHGDLRTFQICCRLVRGFALSDDDALVLLRDWNARCEPPWAERDLIDKLVHARRYGREPIGGFLGIPR